MDSYWQVFLQDNIERYQDEEKLEAEYKELVLTEIKKAKEKRI